MDVDVHVNADDRGDNNSSGELMRCVKSIKVFCLCDKVKTKVQISCAVTAQLISPFAFATRIVQCRIYLYQKSSFLPWPATVQAHLCRSWSETLKTSFLTSLLKCIHDSVTIVYKNCISRSRIWHNFFFQ